MQLFLDPGTGLSQGQERVKLGRSGCVALLCPSFPDIAFSDRLRWKVWRKNAILAE